MLTPRSNTDDLLARLSAVPGAVQASASAAIAAYVRARGSGVSKDQALRAHLERARSDRMQPDRDAALKRFGRPRPAAARRSPSPNPPPIGEAELRQAAVQGALDALGRSS